jgi:flagellar basal-body rod protein FlgG
MDRGLYIAASGMLTELARQDQFAGDLANVSTPGYKPGRAGQAAFGDLLVSNQPRGETVGSLPLGAVVTGSGPDLAQGDLKSTGEPLDVALSGPGFLTVQSPQGVRYTRDGQLVTDGNGVLRTAGGDAVLDDKGAPITLSGTPTIGGDGTISVGGKPVARLGLSDLQSPVAQGDTLFAGTPVAVQKTTAVRQGYLESSGVDPTRAMVDMIASLRAFESVQRVIHAIDESLGRGINGSAS